MSNPTDVKIDWQQLSEEAKDDRRKGKRATLQFPLEIMGKDSTETEFHTRGRTRNVSHHGCCFELDRAVVRGDLLELRVIRRGRNGRVESTSPLPFRAQWVVQEGSLWIVGAEMVGAQGPWGMDFPPKVSTVNRG